MIIFLVIPLILLTINFYLYISKNFTNSYLISVVMWNLILFTATELLSCFKLLTGTAISIFWVILSVLLIIPIILKKDRKETLNKIWTTIKNSIVKNKVLSIIVIVFSILMLIVSIVTVPYNWDSMTYHLSRIMVWNNNHSVDHFATSISRQLDSPPLAEFINLHVYKLTSDSDILFNVLQCASYLVCGFIILKIAKKIGCSKIWSKTAMLLYYAMPIAFAEAFSTQVDNLAMMFLLIFVYFILDFMRLDTKLSLNKENIFKIACLGICLGLCYISKPTVIIAAAIFTLYLFITCIIRKDKFKLVLASVMIVIVLAGFVVTPEILKNIKTYNSISSPTVGAKQIVGTSQKRYVLVNFLKNFAFNLPTKYLDKSSDRIIGTVELIAEKLNVDINDPAISENGMQYRAYPPTSYSHDSAINPTIVWLLIISSISGFLYWLIKRKKFNDVFGAYTVLSIICFILFMFIVRWEIWETRYEIAYLALLCPAICKIFTSIFEDKKNAEICIISIISFICVTGIINMYNYHLRIARKTSENRISGYFNARANILNAYTDITNKIKENQYKVIGFKVGEDDYEYPLWVMLKVDIDEIRHIDVDNESSKYEKEDLPDCIIVSNAGDMKEYTYRDHKYKVVIKEDNFCLLEK